MSQLLGEDTIRAWKARIALEFPAPWRFEDGAIVDATGVEVAEINTIANGFSSAQQSIFARTICELAAALETTPAIPGVEKEL